MTSKSARAMARNPLQEEDVLTGTFYQPEEKDSKAKKDQEKTAKAKPTHYKICCISLYTEDIERLETMVKTLKDRGYTKANKSQIIRYALANVDLDKMPKGI